jgi:hypothetical protein
MTSCALAAAAVLLPSLAVAQGGMRGMDETSHPVANGGIFAPGWMGMVDPTEKGTSPNQARFAAEGGGFHITTGPATTFWNPANSASGDYTVKATFMEPKFMNLNDHPHPYGIVIAGNGMGTGDASMLYCEAYGNGTFIVRGFGPAAFALGGRRATANAAVHKAAGPGQPVTQEIAMSVHGDKVSCSINGTEVASYDKSEVVGAGKLKSLDGVYGVRSAHNTEVMVTGLTITHP